jgi:hypothetical protein
VKSVSVTERGLDPMYNIAIINDQLKAANDFAQGVKQRMQSKGALRHCEPE